LNWIFTVSEDESAIFDMVHAVSDIILFDWPFLGLALGVVGLAALVTWPRRREGSRWRDPEWLICLTLPVYMLHQFEEHGFDLMGRRYQFLATMCAFLGHPDLAHCPADPSFILAVNVGGGVWIPGLLAIAMRRKNLAVGACTVGIPLTNTVAHIVPAILQGSYNPGLFTALFLFIPFCGWTLAQLRHAGVINGKGMVAVITTGLALHGVLIASVFAHGGGFLPEVPFLAINVADGCLPLVIALLAFHGTDGSVPSADVPRLTR
jgi:hypothetical protein